MSPVAKWSAEDLGRRDAIWAASFLVVAAAASLAAALSAPAGVVIALVAAGLLGALGGLVLKLWHGRVTRREALSRCLHVQPTSMREAAARDAFYRLGVEYEAPQALALLQLGPDDHAAYIERTVDAEIETRLRAAAAQPGVHLILVAGPSKAGKSRTLLEVAARALPDARLFAPAGAAAFAQLAHDGPSERAQQAVYIVWIDDVEEVVRRHDGLNRETIADLGTWGRPVLVLGTQGGKGVALAGPGFERVADLVGSLVSRYPPVELSPAPDAIEAERVRERHGDEVLGRILAEGVGEFMIAAPRLVERLRGGRSREGSAVVSAAIDWRRAGLLRPLRVEELRDLFHLYFAGADRDAAFERGLAWATEPLYSRVSLLMPVGDGGFLPYDYLVEHSNRAGAKLNEEVLARIIEQHAHEADELTAVGHAAYDAGDHERAQEAFRRGDAAGSGSAAYSHGALLANRGELELAAAAFRRGADRGNVASAAALGRVLNRVGDTAGAEAAFAMADAADHAHAAWELGRLLEQRGDSAGARAAFQRAYERGDPDGANSAGVRLEEAGDATGAEAAFRRADELGSALGALNHGIVLARSGDAAAAQAAYERADELGSADAANNLGAMLRTRGDLEAAEAAFRRAIDRGHNDARRNLARMLEARGNAAEALALLARADEEGSAEAAVSLGIRLADAGDVDEAEAAFRRADERGDAGGAVRLGILLMRRGEKAEAARAFCRADDRGDLDGAANFGLFLWQEDGDRDAARAVLERGDARGGDHAAAMLGLLLDEEGDRTGAEAAHRRAIERGSAHAANNLGVMLRESGDPEGAMRAYRLADERGCATGTYALATLLRDFGLRTEAAAAFRRADERGHARGAFEVGIALEAQGAAEDAARAFRRAFARGRREREPALCDDARRSLDRLGATLTSADDPEDPWIPCCGGWGINSAGATA